VELSRRGFIKLTGAGLAVSALGALGFGAAGEALAASVRPFKLSATTETRNTCTYCSVVPKGIGAARHRARADAVAIPEIPSTRQ